MKVLIFTMFFSVMAYAAEDFSKMTNAEKVNWSFNTLNKDNLSQVVDQFYHEDLEFFDPIEKIKGREEMKKYYGNMYKNVKEIRFDFSEMVAQGDTVVGVWVMTLKTDSLNDGKPFSVEGNSLIRFKDGKAIYHRDYFDMGAFIYERIPVVGWMVRKVKSKLKLETEEK
jgi:ketosteroid isomerase-like protein